MFMAIVLLITSGDEKVIEFAIFGKCTLGRSSSNDLKLADDKMSGKHGVFELKPTGELFYTDVGSSNGSYLNNSQIQKIQFKINETLRLGNTTIKIDEKKLTSKERLTLGRGQALNDEKTIGMPKNTKSLQVEKEKEKMRDQEAPQKKSITLNKDLKKRANKSEWMSEKENLIDQEKTSGKTKKLKLSSNKSKK